MIMMDDALYLAEHGESRWACRIHHVARGAMVPAHNLSIDMNDIDRERLSVCLSLTCVQEIRARYFPVRSMLLHGSRSSAQLDTHPVDL